MTLHLALAGVTALGLLLYLVAVLAAARAILRTAMTFRAGR